MANPERSSCSYFARAAQYLNVVLERRDIIALQASLILTQYYFRVTVSDESLVNQDFHLTFARTVRHHGS